MIALIVKKNHSGYSAEKELESGKSGNRKTSWEVLLLI